MANELTLQISGWGLMLGSVRSARLPCEAQVRYGIPAAQLRRAIRNLTGFSPVGRSAQDGFANQSAAAAHEAAGDPAGTSGGSRHP